MVHLVRTSWLPETYGERETCEEREKEEGAGTCIFHTTVDAGVCPPFRFSDGGMIVPGVLPPL